MPTPDPMASISGPPAYPEGLASSNENYYTEADMSDSSFVTAPEQAACSENGENDHTIDGVNEDTEVTIESPTSRALLSLGDHVGHHVGSIDQYYSFPTEGYDGDDEHVDEQENTADEDLTRDSCANLTISDTANDDFSGASQHLMSVLSWEVTPSDIEMLENDNLKDQRRTRNPWRTLARFRTSKKTTRCRSHREFPIQRLPAELIIAISQHLPIESTACLALACKVTYSALGTSSFKMPKSNRWKFLLLIEHEKQNSFACFACLKLHRPSLKLIGRKYLEDPESCHEYLSWATLAKKSTNRYMKAASHVIPRMVDGNLLIRQEIYMHPFHKGKITPCEACTPNSEGICGGNIEGCRKCSTDFCISSRDVLGVGHCLVLSCWKDIGGVGPGQAAKWDDFVVPSRKRWIEPDCMEDRRPQSEVGQVYKAFENIVGGKAGSGGETSPYRPQPDWKMVRDLTRRVRKTFDYDGTTHSREVTELEEDDSDSLGSSTDF
ncbi:hypothetical protein J7T55_007554 [Diaporthe amygdali]|uniref:uncharacterized protein n=1 Tax=Phomopsis amygdali TaxID=1214568 RepID=UPI0022FDDD36|nr:uncharacterized protein J7T55_007554 [Diaporthe amygdali]KAJ0107184.1 hypothetical protein J7T55_007554 [Diaporthe amygdali]